ncbi:unnamed protein product [Rotaria sp. Silwood1]|nr:unnamed protein product [Rotaria sp. Silwood1]
MLTPLLLTLIFDDDCIQQARYFETALYTINTEPYRGILGTKGTPASANFFYGPVSRSNTIIEADVVGGSWFMESEWVKLMFRDKMHSWNTGEDFHLCANARKYANVRSFVMPVDKNDISTHSFSKDYLTISDKGDTTGRVIGTASSRTYIKDQLWLRGDRLMNSYQKSKPSLLLYAETHDDAMLLLSSTRQQMTDIGGTIHFVTANIMKTDLKNIEIKKMVESFHDFMIGRDYDTDPTPITAAAEVLYAFDMVMQGTQSTAVIILGSSSTVTIDFEFFQSKQHEIELEQKYDLTAIIIHWERSTSVVRAVNYLLDSNFFKEIIIWNNNPNINLNKTILKTNNHALDSIRIINSKENIKDQAKYRACTEAKTIACFYADDDWDTSFYLKSLIADFRSDPYVLHSVTDPYTFYTNLIWTYFDNKIDLHTGFSWIGCGSIFLREYAQRHLQYLQIYLKNNQKLIYLSDIFFSIWLNDIPSQLNMNIHNLPGSNVGGSFSSTSKFLEYQHESSVLAIRILEHNLRRNQSNNTHHIGFSRKQNRRFPYCVKSSSLKDEFIFFTNILPIDIDRIPFNISNDFERGTRKNLPTRANVGFFSSHTTLRAVDNDPKTCWRSGRNVRQGEFFAIDFLYIRTNLLFSLIIEHTIELQKNLDVKLSLDGLWWITYRALKGITIHSQNSTSNKQQYVIIFDSTKFNTGFHSFRYIAFNTSRMTSLNELKVCDVKIITNTTITTL